MKNLRWYMTKDDYERLRGDLKSFDWVLNNFYGGVSFGKLLIEFMTDYTGEENILYIGVYGACIDDGCGCIIDDGYGKLEDGTSYSLMNDLFPEIYDFDFHKSFEEFKTDVELIIDMNECNSEEIYQFANADIVPVWYKDR